MTAGKRSAKTGSVRRLPSGRWQARFSNAGGPLRSAPGTFDTKFDAEAWLRTAVSHLAAEPTATVEAIDRRHQLGLRYCSGCNLDYRPSRANNVYCEDCTYQNARRVFHMRQARALGTHTASEWAARQEEHGGLCAYCRTRPGSTKDHVVPVSRGGSDAIENIVPACAPCNSSKGARPIGAVST